MIDFLDPRVVFSAPLPERRIYGDDLAQIFSVVDEEDYFHCMQWQWSPKFSRWGRKFYLRRLRSSGHWRTRTRHTRFLHTEIILRMGIPRPTAAYKLVDHRDGDAMNCRRANLRWATTTMNSNNVFGAQPFDLTEDFGI